MNIDKLLFVPIDIDIPDVPLGEMNVTHSRPSYSPFWEFEQLLVKANSWKEELGPYQEYLKTLTEQLPFEELHNVRFTRQLDVVKPHVDVWPNSVDVDRFNKYKSTEPCGYRFVLKGKTDSLKIRYKDKVLDANLPKVPCLYIINSTEAVHFLNQDPERMTLYVRGFVDVEKHRDLLHKSIIKYKDYALYKD